MPTSTQDAGRVQRVVIDARQHGPAVIRARWYLRHADHVGSKVRLYGRPRIENGGRMIIGDRVRLSSVVATLELATGDEGCLEIGENVFINYGTSISASRLVRIGRDTSIGTGCLLMDNAFHRVEPDRRDERPPSAPIELGRNVWLGARVTVLPGVTIGEDSCVGTGSIVTHDIPPRVLAAGIPAKVIRSI